MGLSENGIIFSNSNKNCRDVSHFVAQAVYHILPIFQVIYLGNFPHSWPFVIDEVLQFPSPGAGVGKCPFLGDFEHHLQICVGDYIPNIPNS